MKLGKYIFILILISILVVSGCISKTGSAVSNNEIIEAESNNKINEDVECNDNNPCTEDKFNSETNKCDYISVKNCCGNNLCEDNEGCNSYTYKTGCEKDCGLRCLGKLDVAAPACEGVCSFTGNAIAVTGPSKIKLEVINLGEKETSITSELKCVKKSGSTEYFGYFEGNKDKITLEAKKKANYYIEFKKPDTFNLECDLSLNTDYSVSLNKFTIKSS